MVKEVSFWRPGSIPSPALAVKGAVCWTCLKASPKLNRCGGCKRVWYCSQECQKKDWKKGHKILCPKLATINGVALDSSCERQTWNAYREETLRNIEIWQKLLPFDSTEQRLVRLQPYCATCYRSTFQLPPGSTLSICPACQFAHHCSSCATSHDEDQCVSLRDISQAEKFQINHFLETTELVPRMLTQDPRTTYIPLSTTSSWYDYYTRVSDKNMLPGLISSELKPLRDNIEMACALCASTDETSMILTIIAALEVAYDNLATKQTLNLHLIGTTSRELASLMCFEEVLHLLPQIQSLHCSFVGIEMPNPIDGNNTVMLDCCPACTSSQRTRSMEMWKGTYHDYVKWEHYKTPDLGVAFHTGYTFEEQESWAPTIKHLVKTDHTTVFTTYNEAEMLDETKELRNLGANFVVEGQKNKWKGMRPMLDPLEEVENIAYYQNQYWYVVAGQGFKA